MKNTMKNSMLALMVVAATATQVQASFGAMLKARSVNAMSKAGAFVVANKGLSAAVLAVAALSAESSRPWFAKRKAAAFKAKVEAQKGLTQVLVEEQKAMKAEDVAALKKSLAEMIVTVDGKVIVQANGQDFGVQGTEVMWVASKEEAGLADADKVVAEGNSYVRNGSNWLWTKTGGRFFGKSEEAAKTPAAATSAPAADAKDAKNDGQTK